MPTKVYFCQTTSVGLKSNKEASSSGSPNFSEILSTPVKPGSRQKCKKPQKNIRAGNVHTLPPEVEHESSSAEDDPCEVSLVNNALTGITKFMLKQLGRKCLFVGNVFR
ncbi:hypothetical protein PR048_028705, partial [Dryococelus australis]